MKSVMGAFGPIRVEVAPFAGAWIEIAVGGDWADTFKVAPFAGAWIEILVIRFTSIWGCSRSLRGSVD